ncbi:hypothetical protein LTR84_010161 [Exophiala bonariae]|uniref:CENP-C homolog n=1 Tax=Exophiala bonariae TaxID=1690606 RepID=A0AAV9MWN6_9EURO|nr:hypothetical protein LTR84_010161 [Exophiala bonariae]
MAPRLAVRPDRDNVDYSAIGKHGRRTGVTLDQRPLDLNGMEEITGIFSSPRKPSPLKHVILMQSIEESDSVHSPIKQPSSRRSTRRISIPPPRSSSPKKSGISGTARKSNGVDIFTRKSLLPPSEDIEDRENTPIITPTRSLQPTRFSSSPEKSPLRDITPNINHTDTKRTFSPQDVEQLSSEIAPSVEDDQYVYPDPIKETHATPLSGHDFVPLADDDNDNDPVPPKSVASEEDLEESGRRPSEELGTPLRQSEPEIDRPIIEPGSRNPSLPPAHEANSRRKRKSDVLDRESSVTGSPATSKIRKTNPKSNQQSKPAMKSRLIEKTISPRAKGKQPLKHKDTNTKMSARQEEELDDIIEKVKARPGPARSLYILRRETPADEGVTHTRSGRVSVKPLAYWRNERCVYGGSPGGASVEKGARFPLNSIKEIVRTEEIDVRRAKKGKKTGKIATKSKSKSRTSPVDVSESSESENENSPEEDPDAEPWETEKGTLVGTVAVWDSEEQAATEQEQQIEIAHAPGAIITREIKRSALHEGTTFQYAKLLSTDFFGTGLVILPPGGSKRPKNSRKMHMGFYVIKGRVTVNVGPAGSEDTESWNRFSIGKGGFWQVPRGNQYSIENELDKPARIFFSQACEREPVHYDYEDAE